MYDTLLQLPLFQGVSHEIISELVGKTKLHFTKYANDAVILEAGDNQNVLSFVVSGSVTKSYKFPGLEVTINETISAPAVIDAEYLFGIDLRYPFPTYNDEHDPEFEDEYLHLELPLQLMSCKYHESSVLLHHKS